MPICTETGLPSTITIVLPFRYQPNEPVEKAFTSASRSCPLMLIFRGSALDTNWDCDTGHADFAMRDRIASERALAKHVVRAGAGRRARYPAPPAFPEDAMPKGLDVVRSIYGAFAAGDVPAFLGHMDPEIRWNEAEGFPYSDKNPYVGPEAVVAGVFARLAEDWDGFRVEVGEIVGGDE